MCKPGMELNRCMTKQEAYELRKKFEACTHENDQATRQACFEGIAQDETGVKKGERANKGDSLSTTTAIATGLYAAVLGWSMFSAKEGASAGQSCTSKTIMVGAGVAFLASHFYFKMTADKDFKKLQEEYDKETKSADSFDAQYKAFEYLLKEQQAIKKIASQKKTLYTIMMSAFIIGTGMAAWETYRMMAKPPDYKGVCYVNTATGPNANAAPSASLGTSLKSWSLGTSPQNAIAGLVGSGLTYKLRSYADEQIKTAETNIKEIQEVMAKFQEQIAGFCPKGRDDYNNPRCYCYNDDRSKNNSRTKSQVCQNLWAQDDKNFFVKAGTYARNQKGEAKGCMTIDGKFDVDCKCRNFKDNKSGENACAKIYVSNVDGTVGNALSLPEGVANLNAITSGGLSTGGLNQSSLDRLAAKATKARNSLLNQLNNQLKQAGQGELKLNEDALLRNVASAPVTKEIASETKAADLGTLSSETRAASPLANEIAQAVASANLKPVDYSGGSSGTVTPGVRPPKFSFSLDGQSDASQSGAQVVDFMAKDYNYGKNDIVQREDLSIFDVISNRYNVSGMRRLFGDGKASEEASPDAL
ncbi:MAG: hypothetical protein Fur0010_25510 [Bdellovibrio sp.]